MKKHQINLLIFLYVIYISFIIISDYIEYFFNFSNKLSYLISIIVVTFLFMILRKKIKVNMDRFNKIDIIFIILLSIISYIRIAIPDSSFDTLNYHLYLQENVFSDNTSYNYFPARWINTFSFPLADRMHFFIRQLLSYRLGILLNIFCCIVIYYQSKRLLSNSIKNQSIICIFSMIILISEQILSNMITYYVDLINIPLFMEIIIILFNKKGIEDNFQNYYVLLLSGILVSLKVSNAILLIPLSIIYLSKNYKSINIKTFIIGIPIFIFPILVYIINIYSQTGNPVFPFYNSIFKSSFLENTNWIESFYGPKTTIEKILWPIYIIFTPRRAFDTDIYYGRIGFGYIVSLIIVLYSLYRNIKYKKFLKSSFLEKLSFIYLVLCLIWANFMMGYIRYALLLEVIAGIICMIFIYKYYNKGFMISFCVILMMAYTFINTISDIFKTNVELSWRYPKSMNKESFNKNIKYILNRSWDYSIYLDDIFCIGIVDYNSGYATLLNSSVPIIGINESYINDYGKEKFENIYNSCKNIYTISTTWTKDRTLNYLDSLGYIYAGDERKFKTEFLNIDNDMLLFKIERKENINEG